MNKELLPVISAGIQEGSKVMFVDGSFTVSLLKDAPKLTHEFLGMNTEVWTVIAINVTVPNDVEHALSLRYSNNCIVRNEKGDIAFCSHINIKNIKPLF